ncbi:hypothetical protein Ciccas_013351 [Cichlidogyrus casuarinus]|uniref:EF-hand domain-containing protein n=1 Tax=Cichlidogyrus casuarinus TaxID=1844966 RepID=A0ABD2PKT5_9PLAT
MTSKADIEAFFKTLDADNSGKVSCAELMKALESCSFSKSDVQEFITAHDKDKDGELDINEVMAFFLNKCEH